MRKIIYFVLIISFLVLISKCHAQLTVGVSPAVLDLGEIEPGTSKIARFYLVTTSEEKFFVYMKPNKGNIRTFTIDKYKDYINNYSEEDASSWVEFLRNPVEMEEPLNKETTKIGAPINGAREVIFILKIPEDAEPGYHSGRIDLEPTTFEGAPSMISIKAVAPLIFIFKVPGTAIREGKILEISSGDYTPDGRLKLNIYFQNTGTITLHATGSAEIWDDRGKLDSMGTNFAGVEPGKIVNFVGFWSPKNMEIGKYNATARIDYVTGSAFKQSIIDVYKPPTPPIGKVIEEEFVFPWWAIILIFIVIVLIALVYYYKS